MQTPGGPSPAQEVEFVRGVVARRFPVYETRVQFDVLTFHCNVNPATLSHDFDGLRRELREHGYIPLITYEKGEHLVVVQRRPQVRYRPVTLNLVLLIATIGTTIYAGTELWVGYNGAAGQPIFTAQNVLYGALTFALPLMAILGIHELGHYFVAKRRGVAASLPFFIPAFPPLGTFGAFISLRDPIPDRRSLMEIGAAGPLAGLAVATPLAFLGLALTNEGARLGPTNVGEGGAMFIMLPILYELIGSILPLEGNYLIHPTFFAAWVGFLVTAINLLPAGQLDGGHIARALLGPKGKYASYAAIGVMILLSLLYIGWFVFALLIMLLGTRHPPPLNDITKLDARGKAIGAAAVIVLAATFVPVPFALEGPDYTFAAGSVGPTNLTARPLQIVNFSLWVNNTGNALNTVNFSAVEPQGFLAVRFSPEPVGGLSSATFFTDARLNTSLAYVLNSSENRTFAVSAMVQPGAPLGAVNFTVVGQSEQSQAATASVGLRVTVVP